MYKLSTEDGKARLGKLKTRHGTITTPFFMPIATKGTAKQVSMHELKELGTEALISNSFILYLKPGLEVIKHYGGIHKFMNWNGVVFTDSGGFQILSDSFLHKKEEKGVYFKNPYTGKISFFRPEDAMIVQQTIKSDIAMALDDVPHYGTDYNYIIDSMKRTHDWAERCIKSHTDKKQLLFGICQGGTFKDLREKSAKYINSLSFDGVALGGLGIGEGREKMYDSIKASIKNIDKNKARYLMGVGSPEDILEGISLGIDCFDSRFPTMNGRHGSLFTKKGKINIEKKEYEKENAPIDEGCKCFTCKHYTKGFLHHIYRTKEPIAERYGNIHNLYFIQNLIKESRKAIKNGEFNSYRKEFIKNYNKNYLVNHKTVFTYK